MLRLPEYAKTWILNAEGRFSDHPLDPGGATNFGISSALIKLLKEENPEKYGHIEDVKEINEEFALKIYEDEFWKRYKVFRFKYPMDLIMFDSYVQHGPKSTGVTLQRSINIINVIHDKPKITIDGIIGPITLDAYYDIAEDNDLHIQLCLETLFRRTQVYSIIVQHNPEMSVFLSGWIHRMGKLHEFIFDRGVA